MKKIRKKTLIKLAAAAVAFLSLSGVCIYTVFLRPALMDRERVIYMETQVQSGDLVQGIMENGSVEMAVSSVTYDLDISYDGEEEDEDDDDEETGRYLEIEEVYVVQGQRMEEGDPLFKFTQSSIDSVRRNLENSVSEARVELAEANSEYNTQAQTARSTYNSSLAEADTAQRTYDASMNDLQQQINLLYADIQVLQAEIDDWNEKLVDEDTLEEYDDLKYEMEKAKELLEETDASSVAAYVANYADYQTALSAFEELDDLLQSYRDGIEENTQEILEHNEEILEAQAALEQEEMLARQEYDSAVQGGSLADAIYGYTLESLQDSVNDAQQALADASELLEDFEAFVGEDGVIYADGSGLITEIAYEAGDRLTTAGTMLSYATEDSYSITIDVSEEDISHISVGDTVIIEMNAYPDETWEGTVSAITTSADSSYSSTVNYPVTIHVEGDTSRLFGGMTADITFVTDSVEDVLYVSSGAIVTGEDGNTGVYVEDAEGNMVLQPVTTGFSNGTETEIADGLSEGDTVYIASTVSAGIDEASLRESGEEENGVPGGTEGENADMDEGGAGALPEDGGFPQMGGELPSRDGDLPQEMPRQNAMP
ncbi:MAG TPA: efflux RND transporter periplasmic adaptor subunit [Candidatus Eisenbergiella merdipullorum]|uniref:Efflux RND transporter periplasmic adaptor subunit n=1 Tax=Candidatus Eisenbergiella merdipullorum TaxID=2838553 RepID=A0A9D2I355_9FIRM|nr:efflux RND transporter periplasmic adaptor subunit [Candidatus Eisenbergiella merdipullorum]